MVDGENPGMKCGKTRSHPVLGALGPHPFPGRHLECTKVRSGPGSTGARDATVIPAPTVMDGDPTLGLPVRRQQGGGDLRVAPHHPVEVERPPQHHVQHLVGHQELYKRTPSFSTSPAALPGPSVASGLGPDLLRFSFVGSKGTHDPPLTRTPSRPPSSEGGRDGAPSVPSSSTDSVYLCTRNWTKSLA